MDIYQDYEEGNHVVWNEGAWENNEEIMERYDESISHNDIDSQAILIGQVTKSKAKYKSRIKYLRVFWKMCWNEKDGGGETTEKRNLQLNVTAIVV